MPELEHIDSGSLDLISYFIVPDQNATNLAWLELFKFFPDTGLYQKPYRCARQRLHNTCSRLLVLRGMNSWSLTKSDNALLVHFNSIRAALAVVYRCPSYPPMLAPLGGR